MTTDTQKLDNYEPLADLSEYDKLNKEELKARFINEFNLDESELDKEVEKDALYSKDTADAIANLEYFSENFENSLRGKTLVKKEKEEVYKQTGKALVGENFIKLIVPIIKNFANKAMLLSGKDEKEFFIQFQGAFYTASDMVLERQNNVNVIAIRGILKQIKDIFWNVGSILLKTDGNMRVYMGKLGEMSADVDRKYKSMYGDK